MLWRIWVGGGRVQGGFGECWGGGCEDFGEGVGGFQGGSRWIPACLGWEEDPRSLGSHLVSPPRGSGLCPRVPIPGISASRGCSVPGDAGAELGWMLELLRGWDRR